MQSEAGQGLQRIVRRKEQERLAGRGLFFWGVGNAPSTMIRSLSRTGITVPIVFSIMKGKPKAIDENPDAIVAWNGFIDNEGVEREIPEHILVTSRRDSASGPKKSHYALMCFSANPLKLQNGKPFNHRTYRNAGATGGGIGASQVTALIERNDIVDEGTQAEYEANLSAELIGSYWVKLTQPSPLAAEMMVTDYRDVEDLLRAVHANRSPFMAALSQIGQLL